MDDYGTCYLAKQCPVVGVDIVSSLLKTFATANNLWFVLLV
jgi:hypothetical protein